MPKHNGKTRKGMREGNDRMEKAGAQLVAIQF